MWSRLAQVAPKGQRQGRGCFKLPGRLQRFDLTWSRLWAARGLIHFGLGSAQSVLIFGCFITCSTERDNAFFKCPNMQITSCTRRHTARPEHVRGLRQQQARSRRLSPNRPVRGSSAPDLIARLESESLGSPGPAGFQSGKATRKCAGASIAHGMAVQSSLSLFHDSIEELDRSGFKPRT